MFAQYFYWCRSELVNEKTGEIKVTIPPTRSDIIHACDIVEDVAIAYGFNNIVKTFPRSVTVGRQQLSMKLSERLRVELAMAGFTEALTFSLCSHADIGEKMCQKGNLMETLAVHIDNPKTLDFQVFYSHTDNYLQFVTCTKQPSQLKKTSIRHLRYRISINENSAVKQ